MNAGQLDERIEIKAKKIVENELGEEQPEEITLKKIWARIEPRTGSLLTGRPADTLLSKTTHAITVRSEVLSEVTIDCWIVWNDAIGKSHKLSIDYILPPVRTSPFTTIYAREEV
ncbi:MAG: head-tail adaptor protein [Firmicutes bacterium]|jgi:head-tail adaptor|nr:head-tail adaptor protein [Bacillota bacterium]